MYNEINDELKTHNFSKYFTVEKHRNLGESERHSEKDYDKNKIRRSANEMTLEQTFSIEHHLHEEKTEVSQAPVQNELGAKILSKYTALDRNSKSTYFPLIC